jgi:hypothetical protein
MPAYTASMERRCALVAVSMLLSGCASTPQRLVISQADVQRALRQVFPKEQRLLELFDVSLQSPQIEFLPERNRIAAVLDLRASTRLLPGHWQGRLSFDSELRWNPADQTLRLQQVRVHDLALSDAAGAARSAPERLGAALAERVLEDLAIYRLPAERGLELQRRGVTLGDVAVVSDGIELMLLPVPR